MGEQIPKSKWGYRNESFDKLLTHLLTEMTREQMERLPADLRNKIFRSAEPNIKTLSDAQKDYILDTALDRIVLKVILNPNDGMSVAQFDAMRDGWRKKKGSSANASVMAEEMITKGEFVMADRDLYDAIQYQAFLCYSPVFKMILNARKSAKKFKHGASNVASGISNIVEMFASYEASKRRLIMDYDIDTMSEWYALLHFYNAEKRNSSLYTNRFLYSLNCSKKSLMDSTTHLKARGYLYSRGAKKVMVTGMTAKGKMLVDRIMAKYILTY